MRLGIGEIFIQASQIQDEQAQLEFFRKHWTPALGNIIKYTVDPEFVWDMPEGVPPYKENAFVDQESSLYAEMRLLYIFMKGTGDHVSAVTKELKFIQLLETVSKEDAQVLLHAKEKQLPCGFTVARMREVFPGLLSEEAVDPVIQAEPVVVKKVVAKKPAARKSTAAATRKPSAAKSTKKPAAKKASAKKAV